VRWQEREDHPPDALYEFVVASDGSAREALAFRVTFTDPDETGRQQVQVRRADGPAASHGTEGTLLAESHTCAAFPLDFHPGVPLPVRTGAG
jgi:hypothetical protein